MPSSASDGFATIRNVCEEFGLTLRAVRFYEDKGLVAPTRDRRHRFYDHQDVERLRLILRLKTFGLSLVEIKQIIRAPGQGPYGLDQDLCEDLIERLTHQKASTEAALAELQQILRQFGPHQPHGCRPAEPGRSA